MSNFNTLNEVLSPKSEDFILTRQDGIDVKIKNSNTFASSDEALAGVSSSKSINPVTLIEVLSDKSLNSFVNGSQYQVTTSYEVGFIVRGSDGKQYYCNKINTPSNPVNPVSDATDTWREYPYKEISGNTLQGNRYFGTVDYKGLCELTINFDITSPNEQKEISFPITFSGDRTINYSLDDKGRNYAISHSFFNVNRVTLNLRKYQDSSPTPTKLDGLLNLKGKINL